MILNRLAIPAFALFLGATGLGTAKLAASAPHLGQPAAVHAAIQDRGGWDMAPSDLPEAQHQGFRDGIEGARKDFDNHRRFSVNNRDEFRHPHVPREEREAYREGFRRGYEVATHHLMEDHDRDHNRDRDHDRDHDRD